MALDIHLPSDTGDYDPGHTAGHRATNTAVNAIAAAVNEVTTQVASLDSRVDAMGGTGVTSVNAKTGVVTLSAADVGADAAGAAGAAVSAHLSASDPHGDRAFSTSALAAHVAAADPHPGYLTATEGNAAYQSLDADLTSIAGLSPTNDDVLQRKSGAWINRTPAQLKADLGLAKGDVGLGSVDNTADTAKPVSTATQTALDAKLDISAAPELIRDTMGTALVAGSNVTITPNDGADTITIAATGAGSGTVTSVTAGDGTITIGGTSTDPTIVVGTGIAQSKVTNLSSDLAAKQPLDSDLTAIAAISPTNDDIIQRKSGVWVVRSMAQLKSDLVLTKSDVGLSNVTNNAQVTGVTAGDATITIGGTSTAPTVAVGTIAESQVTSLVSDLAGKQPLDTDLTTIAGLTATTDSFIQSKSSTWASRTPTQVAADLVTPLSSSLQPLDTDLTAIAALTPTNDDIVQRKAGAWTNRTMAQLKSDLSLTSSDVGLGSVANAAQVQLSTIDGKGDLLVGTADNTVTRRAVGTDGQVLTADSGQTDGVKWATPSGGGGGGATDNGSGSNQWWGYQALASLTSGTDNTAHGYQALTALASGVNNTAVGYKAAAALTTSSLNVAVGFQAMMSVTSDNVQSTAVGYRAQEALTSGFGNTAIGYQAQVALTTGSYNVAVGLNCLTHLTTGGRNVALGANALGTLTTGSTNFGLGLDCLGAATTADGNTAIGVAALPQATTGSYNVAIGGEALYSLTTSALNVGIGTAALHSVSTGEGNIGIGWLAGNGLTTGSQNTAIGRDVLQGPTTGNNNAAVGYLAGSTDGTTATSNVTNALMLGYKAQAVADNVAVIGSTTDRLSLCLGNYGDQLGGGRGVVALSNAQTSPSSDPTGGGILYAESGALKWRGSSGTVSTIAPA